MENENPKKLYENIGETWCQVLKECITFNRLGFQHLLRKRGIPRTKAEKERHFAPLPFVKEIIEDPSNNAEFWRLSKEINGKKYFFSVY
jgi:hypothetical protein